MPLINSTTDLKSLRYGKDRPGGGSSFQPFVTKDIPNKDQSFLDQLESSRTGVYGMTAANDLGFVRGGFLRPGAAADDAERILRLFTTTAAGLAFEAKQAILSQQSQDQTYIPESLLQQMGLNAFGIGHAQAFNSLQTPQFSLEDTFGMGNPAYGTQLGQTPIAFRGEGDNGMAVYEAVNGEPTGRKANIVTDKINNSGLIYSSERSQDVPNDVINFDIAVIDNDNPSNKVWIHLRAYLKSFSDSYGASWDSTRYVGRGEDFFKYSGFNRDISMGFDVLVGSSQEQEAVYDKLNYLASCMAPDYSEAGFMRGSIFKITVGDYLVDVPGVLTGLNFNIPDASSWDIARKDDGTRDPFSKQLPHVIEVGTFSFKPIHNFLPRKSTYRGGAGEDPYTKFIGRSVPQVNTDIANTNTENG